MINLALSSSPASLNKKIKYHGLQSSDGNERCWLEDDPSHPRNWPLRTKVYNTVVIISLDFFTTICSTSGGAAARPGQLEFGVGQAFSIFAYTSIYLFSQGIGSIFFSPISGSFGRKRLYVISMFLYVGFSLVVGEAPHIAAVAVGRFFCGLLSSIPTIIVASSIEGMYGSEASVWMIFARRVAANIGLSIGPIYSTYITEATIVTFTSTILTIFLKEPRPSQILKKRLARLNRSSKEQFTIDNPDHILSWQQFVTDALSRPTRLFSTEPIVFLVTIMASFAWTIPPSIPAPWPVSFLPLILAGFATNEFDYTLGGYLTDSYTTFSASTYASLAFLRAVVSGVLPLFTNQMYGELRANKVTTILAVLATLFCMAPALFLEYGERLGEGGEFARYSREAEKRMGSFGKLLPKVHHLHQVSLGSQELDVG
ncbi:MFS general substrate transporter [Acephala macrosclerotiorum]|nr:MFS general substrate transporter [Acephala macrosclerotiorum]